MGVKEVMYSEVEAWRLSGQSKADFLNGKNYTLAKFNYWILRYNKENKNPTKSNFKAIPINNSVASSKLSNEKLVELDLPTGVKITVYR
jgi:hypothetical protein